jgi:hypothetical protein
MICTVMGAAKGRIGCKLQSTSAAGIEHWSSTIGGQSSKCIASYDSTLMYPCRLSGLDSA